MVEMNDAKEARPQPVFASIDTGFRNFDPWKMIFEKDLVSVKHDARLAHRSTRNPTWQRPGISKIRTFLTKLDLVET